MKYRVEHSVPHHAGSQTYKLSAGTIRYCTGSSGSLRIQHLPTRGLQHCQACAWLFCGNSDLKLVYLVFLFVSDTVGQPYPCSVIKISPKRCSEKQEGPSAVLCLCIVQVSLLPVLGDTCHQLAQHRPRVLPGMEQGPP